MAKDMAAGGELGEAMFQAFQNMVLVMHSGGFFAKASAVAKQDVLGLTWTLVGSFCPDVRWRVEEALGHDVSGVEAAAEMVAEMADEEDGKDDAGEEKGVNHDAEVSLPS